MRGFNRLGDVTDTIETVFSTPMYTPGGGTDTLYSGMDFGPLTLPSLVQMPANPQASTINSDWFTTDVAPILTTAINAGASIFKSLATPASPYGLPAGVSSLAFNAMTPAQQQSYLQQQAALASPLSAQIKSMLPMLLLSGAGLLVFMLLKKKH